MIICSAAQIFSRVVDALAAFTKINIDINSPVNNNPTTSTTEILAEGVNRESTAATKCDLGTGYCPVLILTGQSD